MVVKPFCNTLTNLNNAVTQANTDMSTLKDKISKVNDKITTDKGIMNQLITDSETLAANIDKLDKELNLQNNNMRYYLDNDFPEIEAALANFQTQMSTISNGYYNLNNTITNEIQPELGAIATAMTDLLTFACLIENKSKSIYNEAVFSY